MFSFSSILTENLVLKGFIQAARLGTSYQSPSVTRTGTSARPRGGCGSFDGQREAVAPSDFDEKLSLRLIDGVPAADTDEGIKANTPQTVSDTDWTLLILLQAGHSGTRCIDFGSLSLS
jgi:hypothetical protein